MRTADETDSLRMLTLWGELDDLREFAEACEAEAFRSRVLGRGDAVTLTADDCAYLAACCRAIGRAVHGVMAATATTRHRDGQPVDRTAA